MKRYMSLPSYFYPPDTGAGAGGGTTENSAGMSSSEGSVSSGTASDAMIAAFAASSAAEESSTQAVTEEAAPAGTGDTTETGTESGAAKSNATGSQAPTGTRGEAPQSRIEAAVKNARAEATAEVEKQYAWAKGLDAQSVSVAFDIAGRLLDDSQGFATKLAAELGMKLVPIDAPVERPTTTTAATGQPFKLPEGKLRSEDGIRAFSEDQVGEILQNFAASLREEFQGHLKPLNDTRKQIEDERTQETVRREAKASVTAMMTDMRARPHFQIDDGKGGKKDHPEILKNLMAIPERERARIGVEAAVSRAYTKYLTEHVFPTIGTTAAASVREENARKVAGSSSANPVNNGGDGRAVQLKDGDTEGLAAHMRKMAATMGATS